MANPVVDEPIAALYDATTKLNAALAAGTASESGAFEHLVASASSPLDAVRQLCADSLPTFFHQFPAHADAALSAYFDLLEDGNATVRLHALRGLPTLAKHNPSLVPRLADVLAQLLVTEEPHELQAVQTSLSSLFSLQHRACFAVLVSQLKETTDERLREKAAEFLLAKVEKHWKQMTATSVSAEEQAEYAAGIKTVLGSVDALSARQSRFLLSHLLQLRVVKDDPNVKQDVAAIIAARARLDREFQPTNAQAVEAFISGLRAVNEYKKYAVDATPFLVYFQSRVLPVLDSVPEEQRLQLVRAVANQTVVDPQLARTLLAAVWEASKAYLPLSKPETAAKAAESSSSSSSGVGLSFRFQLLESLLAVIHHLAAAAPDGARDVLGLFISTGQPADARVEAKKQETVLRLTNAQTAAAERSSGLPAVLAEEKRKLKAATDEEARKAGRRCISQLSREQQAAASLPSLCKPLLAKTPTFLAAPAVSWRRTGDREAKKAKGGEKETKAEKKQPGKKQKTSGAESAAAGQEAAGKKEKGKAGGGQPRPGAKAGGGAAASAAGQSAAGSAGDDRRKKGREQQRRASAGAAGGGGGQTQQSARNKKRKSAPASSQQPPQQQQGGSGKRSRTGAGAASGSQQQQQAALASQQMAAASAAIYNQMVAQVAAQVQQQAAGMQQQLMMQQQQQQQRAAGGSGSRKRSRARR